MIGLTRFTSKRWDLDNFEIFDDFTGAQSDITFVDTVTDTGTVIMTDERCGIAVLTPSDGTVADNDEVYLASANENFIFMAGKPFSAKCRLQFAETAAGIYSVCFGFQNAVGANSIVDDTGLPKVTGSAVCIYKTDGSSVWKCVSSCNGTATHSTAVGPGAAAVGATWYVLEINVNDYSATHMQVAYQVDGVILKDSSGRPISHYVAIASATEMEVFVGAKLGAITNNDATKVDYILAGGVR